MIEWYTLLLGGLAILVGLFCVAMGLAGRKPDDFTLGAALLVEVLLLIQVVLAIVAPLLGNLPTGNIIEFWAYLISAAIIPPLAGFWGLVERTRWSTVVLGVACLAVAVMVFRMNQIWFVQLA